MVTREELEQSKEITVHYTSGWAVGPSLSVFGWRVAIQHIGVVVAVGTSSVSAEAARDEAVADALAFFNEE